MSSARKRLVSVFILGIAVSVVPFAKAQCPAYGHDSTCGAVITITDTSTSILFTGQGPYDGADDTLVGVVNKGTRPIPSLVLSSALPIFGLDGDGIDAYGAPGNAKDNTGYGGPNTYFTDLSTDGTSGTVNFVIPLGPGQSTYFSLENALNSAYSCADIINNSVARQVSGKNICSVFTPKLNYSLPQAARACGFTGFDWVQMVTHLDNPTPYIARNAGRAFNPAVNGPVRLTSASTPFNDPPQGGGYAQGGGGGANPDNSYPFYYDATTELPGQENGSTPAACTLPVSFSGYALTFHDAPANPCLPGGGSTGTAACLNGMEANGSYMGFTTHLAGINKDGTATDLGIGFTWTSNNNGHTGGAAVTKTSLPADGDGTGGVTMTGHTDTTTYVYQGFTVQTVTTTTIGSPNPSTNLHAGEVITLTVTVTAASGTAIPVGSVTIINNGHALSAPLDKQGKATFTGSVPVPGTYSVTPVYTGAPGFAASSSAPLVAVVGP